MDRVTAGEIVAEFLNVLADYKAYDAHRPAPPQGRPEELPPWMRVPRPNGVSDGQWAHFSFLQAQVHGAPRSLGERFAIEDHLARVRPFVEEDRRGVALPIVIEAIQALVPDAEALGHLVAQYEILWESIRETPLFSVSTGSVQDMSSWEQFRHVLYGGVIHGDRDKRRLLRTGNIKAILGPALYWLGHVIVTAEFVESEIRNLQKAGLLELPTLNNNGWDFAE